jgi:hypothetical protein
MGVLFGGVLDEEKDEDDLESIFYNDMWALRASRFSVHTLTAGSRIIRLQMADGSA